VAAFTTTGGQRVLSQPEGVAGSEQLSIVVVGHVDHGKSTLLGRLYADTGSLPDGKLEKVRAICRQQGKEFEYAFLFDAFLEEQEQGITIDTARTFFRWGPRDYIIIDAPGHKEFLKNMISGAARAEAALLVIDANEGVQEQSRRHGHLLSLLGVRQVAVVVNKMDLVGYDQTVFDAIEREYRAFLGSLGVTPERVIPASAKLGDNVAERGSELRWYAGPTVLEQLGLFARPDAETDQPLRFPVQDVYKFDERRILAGRISAGQVNVGDRLVFAPSNKSAVVRSIEGFNVIPAPPSAEAGRSVGLTLDEQIFVERGEVASIAAGSPDGHIAATASPLVATAFRANVFWLGTRPLEMGKRYLLRLATQEVACEVSAIHHIIDAADLEARETRNQVAKNEVAELILQTKAPIACDRYADFADTGRFVLVDEYDVAGGGIIIDVIRDEHTTLLEQARERDLGWLTGDVTPDERASTYGHRPALVLLTGDAAAASTLGRRIERRLVSDGRHAYLLEGENLRRGLEADLVASARGEIARRLGEVARLLLDTGLMVVCTTSAFRTLDTEAIVALVHPTPVVRVHLGSAAGQEAIDADLVFAVEEDPGPLGDRVERELRERGILTHEPGVSSLTPYANYSI
jgi:bifunctional enzyme CysN/CysC